MSYRCTQNTFCASKLTAGNRAAEAEMIRIITIEREYGSGAAAIAETLAERLGWKLWDQLLTEEIARLAHCERSAVEKREERRDPLYYRLLKSFARGSYEGSRGARWRCSMPRALSKSRSRSSSRRR